MKEELEKVKAQLRSNPTFAEVTVSREGENLRGWFNLTVEEEREAVREARLILSRCKEQDATDVSPPSRESPTASHADGPPFLVPAGGRAMESPTETRKNPWRALAVIAALVIVAAALWYWFFRPKGPTAEQLRVFRDAKSVCVQVEQTYQYDKTELRRFSLPFEDIAKRSLSCAGLRVVTNNTDGCDAILRVNARGRTSYRCKTDSHGFKACAYADASVSGEVCFQVTTVRPYTKSFKGSVSRISEILMRGYISVYVPDAPSPTDAPWEAAFSREESSFPARILLMVGELYGAQPLQTCLNDENEIIRQYAAWALGETGDKGSIDPLVVALENDEYQVRKRAAEALRKLHWKPQSDMQQISYLMASDKWDQIVWKYDREAIEPLVAALNDRFFYVRYRAAEALGDINDRSAIGPLIDALLDADELVRSTAARALRKITGQDFGESYSEWSTWWQEQNQ